MPSSRPAAIRQDFASDAATVAALTRGALAQSRFCLQRSASGGADPQFTYFGLEVEAVGYDAACRYVDGGFAVPGLPTDAPFSGGLFTYLPYEFDRSRPDDSGALFWLIRTLLIIDHGADRARLVRLVSGEVDEGAEQQRLAERFATLVDARPDVGARPAAPVARDWEIDITAADYVASVAKIQDAIARNEISQAILSIGFSKPTSSTVESIFEALRRRRPSPHVFLVKSDEISLVGASPAMHLLKRGDTLTVETDAGTRRIGLTAEETEVIRNELLNSAKDREEQQMLVDETASDLQAIAVGSRVTKPIELEIRQLGHLMHIFTVLEAKCPADLGAIDAVAACLPAVAVTGAPKRGAMATIRAVEGIERGPYGGVVGLIGFDASVDSAIILRSAWLKDGRISMRCGGGITHASVATGEYDECLNKARAMMDAVEEGERA